MPVAANLTGLKFTKLTAIRDVGKHRSSGRLWLCRCDCGGEVVTRAARLKNGHTQSCGCLHAEVMAANPTSTTHGMTKGHKWPSEYNSWCSMRQRCLNPNSAKFYRYGARGITICDRWLNGEDGVTAFECFYHDMGQKPSDRHSVERRDTNGNYEPGNCEWAIPKTQQNNRSSNTHVECDGDRKTLAEWSAISGVPAAYILPRMRIGWSAHDAIFTKPLSRGKRRDCHPTS